MFFLGSEETALQTPNALPHWNYFLIPENEVEHFLSIASTHSKSQSTTNAITMIFWVKRFTIKNRRNRFTVIGLIKTGNDSRINRHSDLFTWRKTKFSTITFEIVFNYRSIYGKKQQQKRKSIEVTLWEAANKLRGSVEPAEYKHVVLGLIFLKFGSDKFEEQRKKLIAEGKEKYIEMPDFYNIDNVFYLDEISRWSYIIKNSKQNDIALNIDTALHHIEKNNKALKGALPDNYFTPGFGYYQTGFVAGYH